MNSTKNFVYEYIRFFSNHRSLIKFLIKILFNISGDIKMDFISSIFDVPLTTIGILLLVLLVTYFCMSSRRPKNFPPGLPALPVVGSLPFMNRNEDNYAVESLRLHEKYGDIYSTKLGSV